ncbi:molybdate ABC transporter substrate-binding protein [Sulfurimonas aquatica]|uniref:Molybdate ABC transporter substrate-binding protein n=1 Tax=Sulfurimonas aquatica TaxID=2672570 RepID=A0A975GCY9_9BACT|nr:molybdate ABC transporter substrate-binding protein [Sulfurimonas aquatica]QSZ42022.1 molybdate ABC transporter substrate-binding protein [Sulfurimonas aquatica]
MLKKILILSLLLPVYLLSSTINIAVATNVSYAMDELKKEFHNLYPDINVRVTLGSSGKLTPQIKNGAPYDVFMSANMSYPKSLYKDKIAITKPRIYAQGSLSYLSAKKQDFFKGVQLLKDKKIKKIAIANPKTAPYGKAALEALKKSGVYNQIKNKLVYAESASQSLAYSISAADIGFVASSALYSPKMKKYKEGIHWSDVNATLYTPINQGIVLLKHAKSNREAKIFYDFILSPTAKKILLKFGYKVL